MMRIYTKGGDKGHTSLVHTKNISKSDDRIQCVGTMDELTSQIGVIKTMLKDEDTLRLLENIQQTLMTVMAGVADQFNRAYKLEDTMTETLEKEIDRLEGLFERPRRFILPGGCRLSAQIDVARTVARRAERTLSSVELKFGADNGAKKFLNRLADYLYVLARYTDAQYEEAAGLSGGKHSEPAERLKGSQADAEIKTETIVQEVLKQMGVQGKITLKEAKHLIEIIEKEAERRGKKAVIAVCGPEGNPIAVHVMDGAFLVSFDVAVKKAYTSVAVKMSTMELSKLAQPGGTFYGLDKMENGKIVIFGGGIPIKVQDTIIGGLGVSGGTGEEDHSLAEYGLLHLLQD